MESREKISQIMEEVKKVVIGKDLIIKKMLTAILAQGHILLEDIPGVGKTTLALAFSKAMELEEHRMQFTPDVLPTDVVGFNIFAKDGNTIYKQGAVMCNLFLADEINRTSSKTQSALLEVMEEGKVTVDGITREIPKPFIVIATQNPVGSIGTQLLPESQLDRFIVRLTMGYPDTVSEISMLKGKQAGNPVELVSEVAGKAELLRMQEEVDKVYLKDDIYQYIVSLVNKTREHTLLLLGISPRGTVALMRMAKAAAYMEGRNFVVPQDVRDIFYDVTAHRLVLSPKAKISHSTEKEILEEILHNVPSPAI